MPYPREEDENNLTNIHTTMQYDMDSKPAIRTIIKNAVDDPVHVSLGGEDVLITGNVFIPGTVNVSSSTSDPVHVHLSEIGTSGVLDVPYMPIDGNVTVKGITNVRLVSNAVTVSGNVGIIGNVNIGTMPEVEIKNDINNPIPVSANTSPNSNNNPIYVKGVSDASFFAPTQSDAFGRLRVSNPLTLWDSFHRYQDNGSISVYTSGTASSTHDANSSSILMTVGSTNGDSCMRESDRVFAYQPGKSLQIFTTFCMADATGKPNLRQRIGYFDTANGIFLQLFNNTVSFIRRSSSTGSLTELKIDQANWNVDTLLNGTGPSGKTLDITKAQIMFIDVEWLGVGSVRVGFVIDGQYVLCHVFNHANHTADGVNYLNNTTTYMGTACLPVRAEITNVGSTSGSSTYRQICTSVISEGGYELHGRPRAAGHDFTTPYNLPTKDVTYPVFSMRLKANRFGAIVLPKNFSIATGGNINYGFKILSRATTSGGTWIDAGADSSVEYNLTPTAVVSGDILEVGYIISSNQTSISPSLQGTPFTYQLSRNTFTNTTYEFVIVAVANMNNSPIYVSANWEEVT